MVLASFAKLYLFSSFFRIIPASTKTGGDFFAEPREHGRYMGANVRFSRMIASFAVATFAHARFSVSPISNCHNLSKGRSFFSVLENRSSVLENRFSSTENRFSANGVFLENGFSRIALLSEKIGSLLTNQRDASVKSMRSLCEIYA